MTTIEVFQFKSSQQVQLQVQQIPQSFGQAGPMQVVLGGSAVQGTPYFVNGVGVKGESNYTLQ